MKIILVQAEIELALRAYVLNQISVREGQEITIAFKNTRGDDGATAEIDISTPSTDTPMKRSTAPAPTKSHQEASVAASEPEVEEDASDPSDGSPAPAVEAESDTTASEEEAPVQDATTTSEAEAAAEMGNQKEEGEPVSKPASFLKPTAQPSDEAPAPSKSLFANLTKPVNPKPE